MNRVFVAAALVVAGCGYSPPAQVKAIRGDWIADGTGQGSFRVLIIDPSLDQDFIWCETYTYAGSQRTFGVAGTAKWEQGKITHGGGTDEIVEVTADSLLLRNSGTETRYRRMTEADYDRVDWTVSKIKRLKDRGPRKS